MELSFILEKERRVYCLKMGWEERNRRPKLRHSIEDDTEREDIPCFAHLTLIASQIQGIKSNTALYCTVLYAYQ